MLDKGAKLGEGFAGLDAGLVMEEILRSPQLELQ